MLSSSFLLKKKALNLQVPPSSLIPRAPRVGEKEEREREELLFPLSPCVCSCGANRGKRRWLLFYRPPLDFTKIPFKICISQNRIPILGSHTDIRAFSSNTPFPVPQNPNAESLIDLFFLKSSCRIWFPNPQLGFKRIKIFLEPSIRKSLFQPRISQNPRQNALSLANLYNL